MVFHAKTLDFNVSPYTGLTRQSWIEAGEYLLEGIFENIKSFDDPVVMPRKETEVTYPHSADAVWEFKAEYFEGLTRTLFIAAPLIHDNPELTVCGYNLREYYKSHILRSCIPEDPQSVGTYRQLQELTGDPLRTFQQTVETCALVICLWISKEQIWDTYTKEEKDIIAGFLSDYAHGNTVPQNWRLFNMLDMAFLHMEGYPVDETIMLEHAKSILDYYAGDGWYRDGHSFDYYSCWAFNVYAPIWNQWYGYEHAPYLAQKFEEYSNRLMESYDGFFDRDGFTNMWGRSNIYRNAATSAFDGNLMLRHATADPGLARRISSGSLLQFLTREDFRFKGVPTLGFYGQFTPLVQGYSCAESPFWLGKAFLCLHLPADHPFWTAKENNGAWEALGERETRVTALDGPALCVSNHQANGETVLRSGKVVKNKDDRHGMWNYSKLCFNTKYPWESEPDHGSDTLPGEVESQQYVLRDLTRAEDAPDLFERANVTFWHGQKEQVLYRRQFFNYELSKETHWMNALNLADFTVPYGVIRADKLRLYGHPAALTLGAYGFPDNGTEIRQLEKEGAKAVVLKGHDFTGREKQLAMTIYDGWEELGLLHSEGTNPDSEKSVVVYAKTARRELYHFGPYVLISQVITKESLEDFSEEELFPIEKVEYTDPEGLGSYGPVRITLKDGTVRTVDFEGMEGKLEL
ncbi:MAG: DUF2264 domain-containing protein [Eubacteriales bacterium]|nr:DUF2264 domain-containing protein [Eubacteriales bacterium]